MVSYDSSDDRTRSLVALTPGMLVSHYRIVRKIGSGGMGDVYLATDTVLDRPIALKFLPQQCPQDDPQRSRFQREVHAVARLNHPNIVQIFEASSHAGYPFFAMEYVAGRTLRQIIKHEETDLATVVDLILQLAQGLQVAHNAGIIHRDIKPSNVLVDADGRPKLIDFGLAMFVDREKLTRTGTTLGTAGYMSPEQANGRECDQRSDLFSLGVILYQMITGHLPFRGDDESSRLLAITRDDPEPLARYKSGVPPELQRIVAKLLQKDPAMRYQTAAGLVADMVPLKDTVGPHGQWSRQRPPTRVRLVPVLWAAGVLVAAALGFWWMTLAARQAETGKPLVANRLAVMKFKNLADESDSLRFGETISSLLITDLSESEQVQVLSSERLYDIRRNLNHQDSDATSVARSAGAAWMLTGSTLQVHPRIVLISQLSEVASGRIIASQRIEGARDDDIFALVDRLSREIRRDLSLPVTIDEEDSRIAEVTTHSVEAYRYYVLGLENHQKYHRDESLANFRRAAELDSTFAMAHFWVARLSEGLAREQYLAQAIAYKDRVTNKEKLYIEHLAAILTGHADEAQPVLQEIIDRYPDEKLAYYFLGHIQYRLREPAAAIVSLNRAVALDSMYRQPLNLLAYVHHELGNLEQALDANARYIKIAPDEAGPHDSRGDIYAWNGQLDEAITAYQGALEINPDFPGALTKLGHMHLWRGDHAAAAATYRRLFGSPDKDLRASGRLFLAMIPLHQGRFSEAIQTLDNGLLVDEQEQVGDANRISKLFLQATAWQALARPEKALAVIDNLMQIWQTMHPEDAISWQDYRAQLLIEDGQTANARRIHESLVIATAGKDRGWAFRLPYVAGYLALADGDPGQAVVEFTAAAAAVVRSYVHLSLARAYLAAGQTGQAVDKYTSFLRNYNSERVYWIAWSVEAHYHLARAYEQSGWRDHAIDQYELFLGIWHDAEDAKGLVADAAARIARLKRDI